MNPLQWMGAVRMRVQAADKNITIIQLEIHMAPVNQITGVCNKQIHQDILTSNCCFRLKYNSSIHNIASSSKTVVSSESGEKYSQIKHCLQGKTVLNKYFGWFWCERTTGNCLFHWRKCYYGFWPEAML